MTGAPEGSPKVVLCGVFYGFMEKPGIEPATPGLQGIALIHYTTGASLILLYSFVRFVVFFVPLYLPYIYENVQPWQHRSTEQRGMGIGS